MPHYYFHRTDGFVDNDPEGIDLPDVASARKEALIYAGASLAENPDLVWDGQEYRIEVTDDGGHVLVTVVVFAVDARAARRKIPETN